MQTQTTTGKNRTGAQLSPVDVQAMQDYARQAGETRSDMDLAAMRGRAIAEAEPIGSVPVPGSLPGVVETGVAMLKGKRPQVLVDKLGERLAFERAGARLYEALITKCAQADGADGSVLDTLHHIEREEREHFELVAKAIETIGADPTAQTPGADVAAVMSSGIMQVVTDPRTSLAQSLNAMLVAELADNAGWEMLIPLVREAGHDRIAGDFEKALVEEQEHAQKIKALLQSAVAADARIGG